MEESGASSTGEQCEPGTQAVPENTGKAVYAGAFPDECTKCDVLGLVLLKEAK